RRARLAKTNGDFDALDKLDLEVRHIADTQRRVAVEICVLHLAFDELTSLIERQAQAPESAAFHLRERTIGMNKRACVDNDRELVDRNDAVAAVDSDARNTSHPSGHVAVLT